MESRHWYPCGNCLPKQKGNDDLLNRIFNDSSKSTTRRSEITTKKMGIIKEEEPSTSTSNQIVQKDNEDDGDIDGLWKLLTRYNCRGNDIFELLETITELYRWSKTDKLFKRMLSDVEHATKSGYSSSEAIDYAVYKNKTNIIEAVKNCDDDDDDFWCGFSNRDIQDVGVFVRIFFAMDHDKLIQKIVKDRQSMLRHRDEILNRYEQAKIETCGSGLYLSPFVA